MWDESCWGRGRWDEVVSGLQVARMWPAPECGHGGMNVLWKGGFGRKEGI